MGTNITYTAYHATDKSRVKSILDHNFSYDPSPAHWLGNGIYFFIDPGLARSWANRKPTKKYGIISSGTVIQAEVSAEETQVLDMRQLDHYVFVMREFAKFYHTIVKGKKRLHLAQPNTEPYQILRCAFFDWLVKTYDIKCVIAYISERDNSSEYRTLYAGKFDSLKLPYAEVQMCVFDASIITQRKEIFWKEAT